MKENLWNEAGSEDIYGKNQSLYLDHLLEQYKLYVEMADRISARRNLANVFFLTLNTSIIAGIGFAYENMVNIISVPILIVLFISFLTICIVWWWLLRSYRNLNSAKFKVIGLMEEKLPSSPYWRAEWKELGEGKSIKKYLPLTVLEQFVPVVFLIIYIVIAISALGLI